MRLSGSRAATALLAFASFPTTFAQDDEGADSLRYDDLRRQHPSLYTGDYGDCLGGESLFNITRYDTAYYRDGTALLFHLSGVTNVREENVILHIGIDAYGENRLDLIVNPCSANISSLCPLEASNPVEAFAVNFLAPAEVANMSQIALDIPDFEGTATLRIFANSSQTEIGCFRAVMHNGRTFSHPYAVSSGLAGFTLLAIVSTFFTAIYGVSVPHIRTHHGHAFSVLLMLESFQTIFLSGALSVDWPSVLPAFRSNFSWSAGLIYSEAIVDSMAGFAGITGNASQVGGAGSAVIRTDGGLIQSIYGRSLRAITPSSELFRRAEAGFNATDPWPYSWHGHPVTPGLPMPGTWSAFPGTLVPSHIPSAGAFLLSLLWWVLAICLAVVAITAVKLLLDFLAGFKLVSQDGFTFFRTHLFGYIGTGVLRTVFVASPPLLTLALLQFNLSAPTGPIAIAAVVFALLVLGLGGVVSYACYIRLRSGRYETGADQIVFEQGKLFNVIPFPAATRTSKIGEGETGSKKYGSMPFFRVNFVDEDPNRASVHQDEAYVKRFGWLTAHYRRTRWWFFSIWFSYQFIRACFLGGGSRNPLAQVFGLFVLEVLAFALFVKLKPYEGQRNAAVVWVLGVCKVVTAGFSIAFLPAFAISRILSTVLGIVIIVVQASLALIVLSLVAVGMVSSWMSVNRNREEFRPEGLDTLRISYYEHLQNKASDLPPTLKSGPGDSLVPNRTFSVNNVRRARKIEDEDGDFISQVEKPHAGSVVQFAPANRPSRANSASSRHSVGSLPRRARPHRASWSSKDLAEWDTQFDRPDSAMGNSIRAGQGSRQRSNSLRQQAHLNSASQTSLRINSDLYEQGHSRRPPLTPACEASEDQVMAMGRIEPNIAEESVDGTSSPPTKSMKDTEPFPTLDEMNETKA